MSGIFGALNLANDTQRVMLNTYGQDVIYTAVAQVLAQHEADLGAALAIFVEETTDIYKERYMLPGGGRLQRVGTQSAAAAVKAYGYWDVAYPLEDFAAQISASRVDFAYMTVQDLDRHLKTVMAQNVNTVRYEMLEALFNSAQGTFVDKLHGSLSIEPLANGDSVTYPPALGSETEATDNHYLESGYAYTAISDTYNPFATIAPELEEHFGAPTGGSNILAFINNAETPYVRALTDFVPVSDMGVRPGDDTAQAVNLPAGIPGRILGRMDGSGVWVSEWRWMPAHYITAVHLDAPKPLKRRVDPADTGLGQGLQLVAESDTTPFTNSHYSNRFGFGVGNRLNGVVMELGTGGTYTVPTGY